MSLKDLIPTFYDGVREFDVLLSVEDDLISGVSTEIDRVKANQWIQTADEQTIMLHEQLLGIIANPETEDLEFRRQRILNRSRSAPPFTLRYLKDQLNMIFGKDNYLLAIDHGNYELKLESSAENVNWFSEVQTVIHRVKPANLVYIQTPLLKKQLEIKTRSFASKLDYKRAGHWIVGVSPIEAVGEEKEVMLYVD